MADYNEEDVKLYKEYCKNQIEYLKNNYDIRHHHIFDEFLDVINNTDDKVVLDNIANKVNAILNKLDTVKNIDKL